MQNSLESSPKYFRAILLFSLSIFFLDLGKRDLWSSGEARAAIIAEHMVLTQDYVIPTMPDGPSYVKPPLFYWMVSFGLKDPNGRIGGLATRLPSLLSALFLILLVFYLGEHWVKPGVGFFSVLVLITNLKFFWMARVGRIDMLLSSFIFFAIISFYRSWSTKKTGWLYLAAISCALGTLAKGPIGVFLPTLVAIIALLYFERRHLFQKDHFLRTHLFHLLSAFLLFLIISLPWYILIHNRTQGEFTSQFLLRHNIARFLGHAEVLENFLDLDSTESTRGFDTKQPFWYLVPRLFGDFFPWSIFLPMMIYFFWKRPKTSPPDLISFSALVALTIFLFFSFSSFKRGDYILPMFPALALLMGYYWHQMISVPRTVQWMQQLFFVASGLFLFIFALATFFPKTIFTLNIWSRILKDPDFQNLQKIHFFFQDYFKTTLLFLGVLGLSTFCFFWTRKKSAQTYFFLLATTSWLVLFLVTLLFFPYFDQIRSFKPFIQEIEKVIPPQTPIIIVGRAYDFNDIQYHLSLPFLHIETDPDPNQGYQRIHFNAEGTMQFQRVPKEPENWEETQWNIFFQLLAQPQTHYFLIREKDRKKIPQTLLYFIYAENKESSRKGLLLLSNVPPPQK